MSDQLLPTLQDDWICGFTDAFDLSIKATGFGISFDIAQKTK